MINALAASCVQSRQFFASTLREKLFELKNEDAIKSENLCDTLTAINIHLLHYKIIAAPKYFKTSSVPYLGLVLWSKFL
jgi:hypothetical protein